MIHSKMESIIKIENISKVFSNGEVETLALNKINLSIQKGDFVAIMGPSGCGKTTLLNIIGLLDNASSGYYYFNQIETQKLTENRRSKLRKGKIGFVFQNYNLIENLNIFQNVELPLLYLKETYSIRKQKVEAILEKLGIAHHIKSTPSQLSGGQQQRVAIARALVADPMLILADEPTGNLDSNNGDKVMNLLQQINREGTTIVIVTHSQKDATYARRAIKLFDGIILNETYK